MTETECCHPSVTEYLDAHGDGQWICNDCGVRSDDQ